jgi:oxygen-independent coproporphyrinogen III oxidase
MRRELAAIAEPVPVDTIFLGGGTPTRLSPTDLRELIHSVRDRFPLADGGELSVEANPADVDHTMSAALAAAGVNRVSLGAQGFDVEVLRVLERDHAGDDVAAAVERLRSAGIGNVSLDLIFGVPGQSVDDWHRTLDTALALEPSHVSTYGLTFEKGTQFWTRLERGDLRRCDDEIELTMYEAAMDRLATAGLEQYEISNFARPGLRCRHNETYWLGRPYHAFGPGAARYLDGRRERNHRSVTTWLQRLERDESGITETETLSPEESARERLVIGLRRIEGIDVETFEGETGFAPHALAAAAIDRHLAGGLLERTPTHLRLTRTGRTLADTVVVDLL